jgi:hypothetical protein
MLELVQVATKPIPHSISHFDTQRTCTIDKTASHVLLDISNFPLRSNSLGRVSQLQTRLIQLQTTITATTAIDLPPDPPQPSKCSSELHKTPFLSEHGSPNSPPQPCKPTSQPPTHQPAPSAAQTQSGATTSTTSSGPCPRQKTTTTKTPGHGSKYVVRKEPRCNSITTRPSPSTKARID